MTGTGPDTIKEDTVAKPVVETSKDDVLYPEVEVLLGNTSGNEGNALVITGRTQRALELAGHDPAPYLEAVQDGTIDDLLEVTRGWVRTWEFMPHEVPASV